jgi:hypothetical protein
MKELEKVLRDFGISGSDFEATLRAIDHIESAEVTGDLLRVKYKREGYLNVTRQPYHRLDPNTKEIIETRFRFRADQVPEGSSAYYTPRN